MNENFDDKTEQELPDQGDDVFVGPEPGGEENSVDWQEPKPPVSTSPHSDQRSAGYQSGHPQVPQNPYPTYPTPPQQGYPMPPNQSYPQYPYQAAYGMPPPAPKKKMNLGLKVFLFVFSFLFVGGVLGFMAFGAYTLLSAPKTQAYHPEDFYRDDDDLPWVQPSQEPAPTQAPDDTPGTDEEIVQPDIDVPKDAKGMSINGRPTGEELSPQEVYNKVLVSTVTVKAKIPMGDGSVGDSVGTGIIITADGFIITNSHVVGSTKSSGVTVITSDGEEYPAIVVGFDKATDLAVLKTEDKAFIPAEIGNSDEVNIGEWVMAIGNPGGSSFSGSLTRGVVSGLNREVGYASEDSMTYIQTDAAINPGNSGGPLVNMYGQVVGINSSKIVADYYEGMGFAIPVTKAKTIVDELLGQGYVSGRVRLGITGQNITQEQAMMSGYPMGILIVDINDDSSFTGTEARAGDVITKVDGEDIMSLTALSAKFLSYDPGDTAEVTLYRPNQNGGQGSEFTVKITLLEDKGETQK